MGLFRKINTDLWGALASLTCSIHCMAVPVFASLGIIGGSGHANHTFDIIFLSLGIILAVYSFWKNYDRDGSKSPLVIAALGFAILITGIFMHFPVLSVTGGVLIAIAHYTNYKLSSSCEV